MSDQTPLKASFFEDHFWLRGATPGLRPTLGQIGLQQFAPYLINSISLSWVTHLASALKAHDMTTTQMRALAVLSISSPVTINELSQFALTEQSTMSRTLDALEEQGFIVRKPRPEDRKAGLKLADQQRKIIQEVTRVIELMEKPEARAVAFPEVFRQLREDMRRVHQCLVNCDVGRETQAVEEDVVETLREIIKSFNSR